jgi:hypothetical protein
MKNALLVLVSVFPLAVGVQLAPGPAEPVIVECYRGEPITVDLLAVRDSAIVVSLVRDLGDDILSQRTQLIRVIPFTEIASVRLEGSNKATSYAFQGGALGALVGLGIGAAIAPEPSKDLVPLVLDPMVKTVYYAGGAVIGGAVGCAIGCGVGSNTRDMGLDLVSPARRNFETLRRFARHPDEEPPWLREKVR